MRIGIADTTFARVDMAAFALKELTGEQVERYTVPGMKDLPVAAKKLIEEQKCDVVIALAWVGGKKLDEQCAHEANLGLIQVELMTNKHILKVFVHESEGGDLRKLTEDRVRKHTRNAYALAKGSLSLTKKAGTGQRQGQRHAGALK